MCVCRFRSWLKQSRVEKTIPLSGQGNHAANIPPQMVIYSRTKESFLKSRWFLVLLTQLTVKKNKKQENRSKVPI